MSERHDIWAIADSLQMDLRAASAKLVELRSRLAGLDLPKPDEVKCVVCGTRFRGRNSLAEHMHVSHDGPVPAAWLRADELAGEATATAQAVAPETESVAETT